MEMLGFAGFALGFMLVIWWLGRLMSASGRNDETTHGGGYRGNSAGF
jgi:hypothetical protein